ncbi:MAG TPA: DUF2341 domain-containing protein [Mucilaginibacter sp.]|nr:DUF2341 domain-containing protein [Mucilaginibacter sp.]
MGKCLLRFFIAIALIFVFNDIKAQSVAITSPVAGSNYIVGDIISVTATASAPVLGTVNKVVFTLGSLTPVTDLSSPYVASLNTGTLAAGSYILTVTNYYTPFLSAQTTISTTMTINIASTTPPTYSNYAFSKLLTLNSATLGITSNLTNFPALVYIQSNSLKISGACADRVQYPNGTNYDFAFVNPNSIGELNYQVEKYDPVAGSLLVWVKIPAVSYATNTPIYFYWGSTTPPVTHDNTFYRNTWASDYLAVFHFNEAAYSGSVTDGTAGAHTGTTTGMTSADLVTGKIGTAYSFDGSSKKITTNAVSVTGVFTISAWVNLAVIGVDQKVMTNQAASGGASGGYKMGVYSTNIPESESGIAVNRASTPNPTAFASGAWHYIQSVYTGSTLSTYVDGTKYKNLSTSTNPSANPNLYIGAGEGGTGLYFNGLIDEPRVSNVAKTADWIKAEYTDQNDPVAFTSVGTITISSTNAAAIPGALTYTWKGVSTVITNANNWDNTTTATINQLPAFDGTATLVIPTGLSNYPSLTAAASLYGLTIASGASINLNGQTLSVGCNIYNSSGGQILYGGNNSSQITWNGSLASQTYTGTNTANTAQLGSMTINKSAGGTVTISGGPVDIYSTLTITQGNLAVGASPAALTLKSTVTQSASVGIIPAGSAITGNVNVERYITGGTLTYRGYRLLSSPVYASTVSGNNVYSINYLKNSIYLTATTTTGGFDNVSAANPTLYLYRENLTPLYSTFLNSNFKGINDITASPTYSMDDASNPSINIPVGNGYLCFFRGNRAATTFTAETISTYVPQTATLSTSGLLNQGQVTVKNWFTPSLSTLSYTAASPVAVQGYNLVGNPYASSIDWENFQTATTTTGIYGSNVGSIIYMLDPASKNYGAYTKGSAGVGTNNASNIISSGQGFFVLATCSCATLIFNESAKTTTQVVSPKLLMGKPADQVTNNQYLRLQLAKDSVNTDDILVRFASNASTAYVADLDAPYKQGFGAVSLSSLSSDHISMAINMQPLPKASGTIGLTVNAKADGIYTLNMKSITGIPLLFDIWLMDAYKKDSLDMRHNTTYAFNLYKADTNSFGSHRFSLVIRQNPALALHLLDFTAAKTANGSQLTWETENEQNYTNFTVERSTDNGKSFEVLGGFGSNTNGTYNFMDKDPIIALDEYRIKLEDLNGTISYSKVIPLMYSNLSDKVVNNYLNVYPNPASSTISLAIVQKPDAVSNAASYKITIMNNSGTIVKTISSSQALLQENVSALLPGTYIIQVVNNKDKSVVGKSKFVKL